MQAMWMCLLIWIEVSNSDCQLQYCVNNVCENYDDWNNGITSGLDVYEPMFKIPRDQWIEKGGDGKYAVKLTIPVESKTSQLFYFCHIHKYMSGMIIVESGMTLD